MHNILQEDWGKTTDNKHRKFGEVCMCSSWDMHVDRQTDTHTHTHAHICTHTHTHTHLSQYYEALPGWSKCLLFGGPCSAWSTVTMLGQLIKVKEQLEVVIAYLWLFTKKFNYFVFNLTWCCALLLDSYLSYLLLDILQSVYSLIHGHAGNKPRSTKSCS